MYVPPISKFLILDVEGVGWPREIGAVYWNIDTKETRELFIDIPQPMRQILVTPLEKRYIPYESLGQYTTTRKHLTELTSLASDCDVVFAHNISHDKQMIDGIDELKPLLEKTWICTMRDFMWQNGLKQNESLETICKTLGVPYENAHHALGDCRLVLACIMKLPEPKPVILQAFQDNWFSEKYKRKGYRKWTLKDRLYQRRGFEFRTGLKLDEPQNRPRAPAKDFVKFP